MTVVHLNKLYLKLSAKYSSGQVIYCYFWGLSQSTPNTYNSHMYRTYHYINDVQHRNYNKPNKLLYQLSDQQIEAEEEEILLQNIKDR